MKSSFLALLLLFSTLATSTFAADGFVLKLLEPGNRSTVSPMTEQQRTVMLVSVEQQEALWKDGIFMRSLSACPRASLPRGTMFRWETKCTGTVPCEKKVASTLLLADNAAMANATAFATADGQSSLVVQNLIPGKTYYWKVTAQDGAETLAESKISSFTVDSLLPRVLCWGGRNNARDLGGMTAMNGRTIPFGKLIRSSAAGISDASCSGKCAMSSCAGMIPEIRTDLDLRRADELPQLAADLDSAAVNYVNIPAVLYNSMFTGAGQANYAKLFRVFANPENYPVNFHCVVGADRTGTLAFLLEAVLGCSEAEIRRDYVFTSFAAPRYFSAIDTLIAHMKEYAESPEETLQCAAERYLLRAGVTPQEIRDFQQIVLGDGLTPTPVLAGWLEITALKERYQTNGLTVAFREASPVAGKMLQCGKYFDFQLAGWNANPVVFAGADDKGSFFFELRNSGSGILYGAFCGEGLSDPAGYRLIDPLAKQILLTPDGKECWSAELFEKAPFAISARSTRVVIVAPASQAAPEGFAAVIPDVKDDNFLMASSANPTPVIDGKLDDAMWTLQKPYELCATDGRPVQNGRAHAWFGTNPAHDTLYFAVKIEDITYSAQVRDHDRDCWDDDEVEIFLSGSGESTYYQVVFNRAGSSFDGKGQDVSWNLSAFEAKTAEVDGGWVLEIALPLEQFSLGGAVELNICTTDVPAGYQRNLGVTGGVYHSREALRAILLK